MYGYIYLIVNKVNGKTYVGKKRLYKKDWYNDNYMGSGTHLRPAQKKYGIENFEKFLICYTSSEKDACEKEIFWISEYKRKGKAEYNIAKGGEGGCGLHSEETKRKISIANTGKVFSDERKRHLSESIKKAMENEKVRLHLSEIAKNRKCSDETKAKMRKSHAMTKGSELAKQQSERMKGHKCSEITRRKMSEAAKKRKRKFDGTFE